MQDFRATSLKSVVGVRLFSLPCLQPDFCIILLSRQARGSCKKNRYQPYYRAIIVMSAEEGAPSAAIEDLSDEPAAAAAAARCVPGQPVAFPFVVDGDSGDEARMFSGTLADHVRFDAPRLTSLLEAGDTTVWMVEYYDGDFEAVRAENVPAGTAAYHRLLDGAVGLEGEAGAGDDDDGAANMNIMPMVLARHTYLRSRSAPEIS